MQRWQALLEHLQGLATGKGLCIALSGGLDSRFVCHAALHAGVDVHAVHVAGTHIPHTESAWAQAWAARVGLPLAVIRADVLTLDGVRDNSRERCYYCKRYVFGVLRESAGNRVLCDGTNADDLGTYRPGLRALQEAGVRSPLAEAGLRKADIRAIAAATGMEHPQQAARPCLLTRLAYGMTPDAATLARIEAAEAALEALGLRDFRLRLTPEPVLQTLPLDAQVRNAVVDLLAQHGFVKTPLLEEAQLSGFYDRLPR